MLSACSFASLVFSSAVSNPARASAGTNLMLSFSEKTKESWGQRQQWNQTADLELTFVDNVISNACVHQVWNPTSVKTNKTRQNNLIGEGSVSSDHLRVIWEIQI